jgi:hypothetical protein
MPRNLHPRHIEELERDDQFYRPASPIEEHRMLADLTQQHALATAEHIEQSTSILEGARVRLAATWRRQATQVRLESPK